MGQQQSASRRHPLTSRQLAESGNNVSKAVRQHVLQGAAIAGNQPDPLNESPRSAAAVAADDPFSASGGLIGGERSAGDDSARGMSEVCGMSVLEAVEGLSEAELIEFRDWMTSAWRCAKCGNEREDWTRRHRLRAIFDAVGMHQPSSAPLATEQPASSLTFPAPPAPRSPLLSPTPSATPPVPPRRPPMGSNRLSPANPSALPPLSPTFGSSLEAHPRSFGSAEAHGKAHFSPHSAAALSRARDEDAQGATEQGGAGSGLAECTEKEADGGTGMAAGEAAEARTGYKLWGRKGGSSRNTDALALASLSAAAAASVGSGGGASAAGGGLGGTGGGGMRPPPLRRTVTATAAMTSSLLSAAAAAFASPAHDLRPAQSSSGSIPLNPIVRTRAASNDSAATSAESAGAVPPSRSPVLSADKPASGPLKASMSSSAGDAGDVRPPLGAQRFALGFSIPRTHSASRAPASGVPSSTPPPPLPASSPLSATSATGATSLHRGLSGRLKGALGGLGGLRRARSDAAQLAEMMAVSGDLVGGNRDGGADGGAAVGGLGEIELLAATAEEGEGAEGGKGGAEGDKGGSGLGGRRRRGRKKSLGQVGRSVSVHAGEQSPFGAGNGEYGAEGGRSAHSSGSSQQSQALGGVSGGTGLSGCPMGLGAAAASAAAAAAAAAAREGGSGRRPMPRSRSYETVAHVESDGARAGGGAWAGQGGERGEGNKGSPGRSSGGSAGGEAGRGEAERGEAGREEGGKGEVSMDRKMLRAITTAQMLLQSDQSAGAGRVMEHVLGALLDMTGSQFGLIGSVLFQANGSPYLKSHAASNIAWTEELQVWYRDNSHRGLVFTNTSNLLGAVLLSSAPVISNRPALDPRSGGVPPGHPPLSAFMGVPLIVGSEMIGMYALANRAGGYSTAMLQELEPLTASAAVMLQAVHERKRKRDAELRLLSVLQVTLSPPIPPPSSPLAFIFPSPGARGVLSIPALGARAVARDGLMTVGGDGRVTWMNGAVCGLFGMEEHHGHADAMGALHVKAFIHSIEGSPHYLSLGLESFVGHMRRATGIRPSISSASQGLNRDGGGAGRLGGGIGEVAEVWENRRQRGEAELGSSPLEGFRGQQQPYQQYQPHQQYNNNHPQQQHHHHQQHPQQQELAGQWAEGQVLFRKFGEEGSSTRGSSRRRSTGLMRFRSLDSAKQQSSNFHNYVASLKS
ncbi:unnamed protein product [Closterium sp. NIES-64]|nr:unnamed protein product [Closterium sp. NIES-64]